MDKKQIFPLSQSIPMELRDGRQQYAQCSMFARNYTDIVRAIVSDGDWSQFVSQYDEQHTPQKVMCQNGWNYDRQAFPNTVVMEVKKTRGLHNVLFFNPKHICFGSNKHSGIWYVTRNTFRLLHWCCSVSVDWLEIMCLGICRTIGAGGHRTMCTYCWK